MSTSPESSPKTAPGAERRAREMIRTAGLRATSSRIAVLSLLLGSEQPLSHGEVVEALGPMAWDRTTLYRNLVDLADAGLLHRTALGDRLWRFEYVDPEHRGEDGAHPHFVCTECGTVACLPDVELPERGMPVSVQRGEVEIQIRGRCDACLE